MTPRPTSRLTGPTRHAPWFVPWFARGLALVAMALQFAFFADHIGANAVAGVGAAKPGDRMGFLEICTGAGILLIAPDGTPIAMPEGCVICSNAAILAFAAPFDWVPPVFDVVEIARLPHIPVLADNAAARFPGAKPIRAPPVALSA